MTSLLQMMMILLILTSLIRKSAEREQDISQLTQRELQELIDDALDAGDYDEVKRLSQYLKEGKEIYLREIERINESHFFHTRR
jgi:ferritin